MVRNLSPNIIEAEWKYDGFSTGIYEFSTFIQQLSTFVYSRLKCNISVHKTINDLSAHHNDQASMANLISSTLIMTLIIMTLIIGSNRWWKFNLHRKFPARQQPAMFDKIIYSFKYKREGQNFAQKCYTVLLTENLTNPRLISTKALRSQSQSRGETQKGSKMNQQTTVR